MSRLYEISHFAIGPLRMFPERFRRLIDLVADLRGSPGLIASVHLSYYPPTLFRGTWISFDACQCPRLQSSCHNLRRESCDSAAYAPRQKAMRSVSISFTDMYPGLVGKKATTVNVCSQFHAMSVEKTLGYITTLQLHILCIQYHSRSQT